MSASYFNIKNSVSDSDIICVRQILTLYEFSLCCYVYSKKLHYVITDFLIVKVKECNMQFKRKYVCNCDCN